VAITTCGMEVKHCIAWSKKEPSADEVETVGLPRTGSWYCLGILLIEESDALIPRLGLTKSKLSAYRMMDLLGKSKRKINMSHFFPAGRSKSIVYFAKREGVARSWLPFHPPLALPQLRNCSSVELLLSYYPIHQFPRISQTLKSSQEQRLRGTRLRFAHHMSLCLE
jgi:hypothetical protein